MSYNKTELTKTIETLFWEYSFPDLTMEIIAQKLEMKKPSLYYHFPSKEAMFLAIIDQSFEIYRTKMMSYLERADIQEEIEKLIIFPLQEKNLFAVASQKGYCQVAEIHNSIREKQNSITREACDLLKKKYFWREERCLIFLNLLEALSKKCCLEKCSQENLNGIALEIITLFFHS